MGLQNILHLEPGSIVWTIISFLIVVWLLGKFAWKPLLAGLKSREDTIRIDLETAKSEREKAEQLLNEYKTALAGARKEASDLLQQARDESMKLREREEAATKEMALKMIEKARTDIQRESDQAKADLNRHVADLTARATSRLLKRTIDPKEHEKLILDALKDEA